MPLIFTRFNAAIALLGGSAAYNNAFVCVWFWTMKRSVLCPMLLAAVGLIYIVLFTCAVNYIAEQVFRFTVFAKPQAVVITVALAASVLFASPLLPFCRKLFERCGAKCRHYFDRTR